DPDGNVITSSTNSGGPEDLTTAITRPGNYTLRVDGFLAANCAFTLTSKQFEGVFTPPALNSITGDYVNLQGQQVDFDGNVNIGWTGAGGELGYEIEELTPNSTDWQFVADVGPSTNTYAFSSLPNGQYSFRVRGIRPGQIGEYITNPSNTSSVLVDRRSKVMITRLVSRAISNVSLSGGVFQLDLTMTSNSTQTYVPRVDLSVISISSASGTVKVINADNGKDGRSRSNGALFGYSQQIGPDEMFSPGEVTGPRTLRFQDSASEMFTFDVIVSAFKQTGSSPASSGSTSTSNSAGSQSTASNPLTDVLDTFDAVLRFTANPLTKTVTVQLISLT